MKQFILLLLVSFSSFAFAESPEWMKNQLIVDNFVWDSIKPFEGDNLEKIKSYSKVIRIEESEYTDPHHNAEVGAKRCIIHFNGIKVKGFYIPGKRFFLEYVEISTPEFILAGSIKVGSTENDLIEHFKHKGTRKENIITYSGETEYAVFTIQNKTITKVQLYGYTG